MIEQRTSQSATFEAEEIFGFGVGGRREVVSTSLESLWQGWHEVTLEETTPAAR